MGHGDMRQGLKECDKLLRKHSTHQSALSLKAYALARLGEVDEAVALGQKVLRTPGALKSSHVIQGLSLTFRVLKLSEDEIAVYSAALIHTPDSEQLYCKIFMAAARSKLYKEQHSAAVALNKLFKQDRYLWWVVTSLLMQAKSAQDGSVKQLQLTLAERMAEKALNEGRLTNTEELRVYLEVLEIQGNHAAMVSALSTSGPLAEKIANDPDLVTQWINLLIKIGDFTKAYEVAEIALEARDNWADYKLYVEAAIAQMNDSESPVQAASANFDKWAAQRGRARDAILAGVELATKLHEAGHAKPTDETADVVGERIWSYVDQFMTKAICYSDIMQYFISHVKSATALGQTSSAIDFHTKHLEQRLHDARAAATAAECGEDAAQSWVTLERIRYLIQALADDVDPQRWVADIGAMLSFGLDSVEAERKLAACSDMTLIACQRIILASFLAYPDPAQRSSLLSSLFKAVCVLEAGIKLNDDQFLLKLYAIRLYLYLSCYDRARVLYDTLNIKNIQFDTLGHLINGHGMSLGCFSVDLELCYDGVSFYDRSDARVPQELESAYGKGTYSNITDFTMFQDNLVHSVQRECTHRCALRGEAFEHGTSKDILEQWKEADVVSIEHTDETIAALHDNRDVGVMGLQTPVDMAKWNLEIMTRQIPLPGSAWIQIFSMVPQIMHYIVCSEVDLLESKTKDLLVVIDEAGQSVSSHDLLLARGVYQVAILYLRALSGNEGFDSELATLSDMIIGALPQETSSSASNTLDLCDVALTTIRTASVATEVFTYAQSVRHALFAQRSPSANAVTLGLSQIRKTAMKMMGGLRTWTEKPARENIDALWLNAEDSLLAPVTAFLFNRRKSAVTLVTKSCTGSWLKSANNMAAHWKKCT
ncbi:mitochondrial distribution and morphology [Coemansia aciculifera]|uniref:Mitochondrial distribution and morphology n=1 Tax=Coemansia aciculifera TaxID=417176 RepID=A0A9W8M3P1_9FUNG|nr:mitochondrial distribution and morphology [Coemansia aciculifera]KAJ2871827.1 mitochondrial distribution and morphology [Coemansia aciculifera]